MAQPDCRSDAAGGRGLSTLGPGHCCPLGLWTGCPSCSGEAAPRPSAGPALLTQPVIWGGRWPVGRHLHLPLALSTVPAPLPGRASRAPVLSEQAAGCRATLLDVCAEVQGQQLVKENPALGVLPHVQIFHPVGGVGLSSE